MSDPQSEAAKIGAGRTYENPSDPALVGTYSDKASKASPEQTSVLSNFPMGPAPKPFKFKGG